MGKKNQTATIASFIVGKNPKGGTCAINDIMVLRYDDVLIYDLDSLFDEALKPFKNKVNLASILLMDFGDLSTNEVNGILDEKPEWNMAIIQHLMETPFAREMISYKEFLEIVDSVAA